MTDQTLQIPTTTLYCTLPKIVSLVHVVARSQWLFGEENNCWDNWGDEGAVCGSEERAILCDLLTELDLYAEDWSGYSDRPFLNHARLKEMETYFVEFSASYPQFTLGTLYELQGDRIGVYARVAPLHESALHELPRPPEWWEGEMDSLDEGEQQG